jgi:WD40 repeat protein
MSSMPEAGLSTSPYPGLRPFRRDEADIFFGREEQVDQLLTKLESTRFLAVVGVSGCGKSSLVRAGMLSALAGGFMASAGPRWRVVEMRPGGHPLANLAQALLHGDTLPDDWRARPDAEAFVRAVLRRGPLGLVELLRESLQPRRDNLLLLVDQFEEIFRFHKHGDANEATAFADLLLESARQEGLPVFVVITMRSDFLGDCSLFAGLPEAINEGQFLIPRLTREQCRAAVAGPAAAFGAAVEPELVNHILNDVGSNPDQLPLMQHALMRVWNRAAAGAADGALVLTLAEYQAVGGLKHALSDHADELYEALAPDDRRVAEVLFRCLSERGADGRDVRRPVRLDAAAAVAQVPAETVVRIVEVFREPTCSFLTPPAGVPLQADTVLDISHESLIRQWRRMAQWVQAEADSAAIFRRLAGTAALWQAGQAALWGTPDLENALCWRERERPTDAWAERYGGRFAESMAFLDASVAARDRQVREEKERQEHERELLQNMARAEKQRADDAEQRRREQARANRQLKRRAVAALAAGALATALAGVAFALFTQARGEQRRAEEARAEAEQERARAEEARRQAEADRRRADDLAAREADLRRQSQQAELKALEASDTALRGLGQAKLSELESLRVSNQPGRQAKAFRLLREAADLRTTAFDLAQRQDAARRDDTEHYWRQMTPTLRDQAVRWLSLSSLQKVHETAFTPTAAPGYPTPYGPFPAQFALSPDASQLAVLEADARLPTKRKLWLQDVQTEVVVATYEFPASSSPLAGGGPAPLALGYSDDGATLLVASRAAGTGTPPILVEHRSATDLKVVKTSTLRASIALPVTYYYSYPIPDRTYWFDRQGTRFIQSSPDGGTVVWDVADEKELFADKLARAVGMTQAEDHLVTVSGRAGPPAVRVIDLQSGKAVREHPLTVGGSTVVVSPDGKWLAAEGSRRYSGSGFTTRVLHLFDLVTGEKAADVPLASERDYYSPYENSLKAAFHDSRPLLAATDGAYAWLIAVPGGGVLHQQRISDAPQNSNRQTLAYHAQFSRHGDLLVTMLRETRPNSSNNATKFLLQSWDPALASGSCQTLAARGEVQDVRFAGDDAVALAGGGANHTDVELRPLQGPGQWETTFSQPTGAFDPSGKHFVRTLPDRFDIYDAATGRLRESVSWKWPGLAPPAPVDRSHRWLVGVDQGGEAPRLRLFDATNLQWTAPLLDAAATLRGVLFDDRGAHVAVQASRTVPGLVPGTRTTVQVATVYRLADGAKLAEVPQTGDECKLTDSGYLVTMGYENNRYSYRAYDVATGRLTGTYSEQTSIISSGTRFWPDRDGKTAAVRGAQENSRRFMLWPFAEGKEAKPLPLDANSVDDLGLFGDRLVVSGSLVDPEKAGPRVSQRAVQLWDVESGKPLRAQAAELSFQVSETNGKVLVYPRSNYSSKLPCAVWDMKTGEVLETFSESFRALSPDRRFALFGSGKLLDLATMKVRPSPLAGPLGQFRFSPDSRYLVLSPSDSRPRVLDLQNPDMDWSPEPVPAGPPAGATTAATPRPAGPTSGGQGAEISPDGRLVGFTDSNAPDRLQLYDLPTGRKVRTTLLRRGNDRPDQLAPAGPLPQFWFSPDGAHVAAVVSDRIHLGNTDQPEVHTALPRTGHRLAVSAVDVSPDGRFLASAGADGTVCFWRAADGRFLGMLDIGGAASPPSDGAQVVRRVAFSPRGNLLAVRRQGGEIAVWKWSRPDGDAAEVAATFLWSNTRDGGTALAFSPDGAYLAAGEAGGGLRVFHTENGHLAHLLKPLGRTGAVQGLAFTPDGKRLVAARGQVVALWDVAAAAPRQAWDAGQGSIHALACADDGRSLVTAGKDVRVWEAATGGLLLKLDPQSSAVRQAALSPSGRRLAAAVEDGSVVVTDVTELLAAVDGLGLKALPEAAPPVAWKQPLWAPEPAEKVAAENTVFESLPRALRAERDGDWKLAVEHWTRLVGAEPDNLPWLSRRMAANERLKDWPAAAADQSLLLEHMPADWQPTAPRSLALHKLFREKPEVFAALEKLPPKDALPAVVSGRESILRSQWQDAKSVYGSCVRAVPASGAIAWFEYAGVCLIAGDPKAYQEHVAWMQAQAGQPKGAFMSYCYARAAGLAAETPVDKDQLVKWAEAAVAEQRSVYSLHTAGLAYCRAGQLDKAREALDAASKVAWAYHSLNWLVLGIVEHEQGNDEAARELLDRARAWRDETEVKGPAPLNVQAWDWVEFRVLLPELEALVGTGSPKGKAAPRGQ